MALTPGVPAQYNSALMSSRLPLEFDPRRLADEDTRLTGSITTDGMRRLAGYLARESVEPVDVELHAHHDEVGRPVIEGRVAAQLPMICQRCTEPVMLAVTGEFLLGIVKSAEEAERFPDHLDPLILDNGPKVKLAELVEDELILGLPVVARHERMEDCGAIAAHLASNSDVEDTNEEGADADGDGEARKNPFAILQTLKNENSD